MSYPARVKAVSEACEDALVRHGFQRLRRHSVAWAFSKDFLGWIGLNVGNYPTHVQINPFVGIHCVPLMKPIEEISGNKYQLGRYATYAVHLGEVCDEGLGGFLFPEGSDIEPVAERLAVAVCQHGVPYMQTLADYEALLPLLQEREAMRGGYPERVAVCLVLLGRQVEAHAYLDAKLKEYQADTVNPDAQVRWQRFADELKRRMRGAGSGGAGSGLLP